MISGSASLPNRDVQDRRLSIIDVSSADDSLLHPFSANHHHLENQDHAAMLYTPNSKKFEDAASKVEEWEREPQSVETSEIEKPKKTTKCNLRKSLAWDSAFFTSAGVLDPEELSSIIEGVEKEEKHVLPGIQEDVYKSCDSISTLGSDSLTLESLEGDLFEDVRASIQKSSKKPNLPTGNSKVLPRVARFQTCDSSKKLGMAPHNKMKAPLASKTPSAGMQGSGKMTKKNPIFPQLPQKPVATRRESSILKQSRVSVKSSPSSTVSSKRVSLGDLHVKSEKDKAKRIIGDRVSSVSKASVIGGSRGRGLVPKPTPSSKSPSGPSVSTKMKSATSASPAVRTPSRIASRNKTESGKSSLSGLMSVTKLSSSISPASSISDWSSESPSSTLLAKHMCNSSRTSLESCSSRKISDTDADQGLNAQIPQTDSSFEGHETQHTGLISQGAKTAPGGMVPPQAPMKASGLRLPSPKIGFFDGVKSSVRTPRGGMQPHSVLPRGLPKHGVGSPNEGQNKAKLGKLQPTRSIMPIETTKPSNQQNSHPIPLHESSDVAVKKSSAFQNVKNSSDIPKAVQNETHLKAGAGAVENSSPSHVVEEKAPRLCQLDVINPLHPLKDVKYQENAHCDNEVDCLSKQVGLKDINFKTQEKFNGDSLPFSQNDTSSQDKSDGLELSSQRELIDCPKKEGLKGSSTPSLSTYPTCFDMAASVRTPFAVKDSICNMDGSVFTESTVSEVKPANLPVLESIMKENS